MNLRRRLLHTYQRWRVMKYRLLSDNPNVSGKPIINQPVQFLGKGKIIFHGSVNVGIFPGPFYLSGYIYIEARNENSVVEIEDGVWINNNCFLLSAGSGIYIGKRSTLGLSCQIIDSDFHEIHPERRHDGVPKTGKVIIEDNVMVASNVKIMRGVTVGKNSVIANGSVITRSIPPNMLAYGNPMKCGPLVPDYGRASEREVGGSQGGAERATLT